MHKSTAKRRRKLKAAPPTALVVSGPYIGAKVYARPNPPHSRLLYQVVDGEWRKKKRWIWLTSKQYRVVKPLATEPTWRRRIEVRARP